MTAQKRPTTPNYLREFVLELYDHKCLKCGTDRPLDVAHLKDWPTTLKDLGGAPEKWAYWEFHHPANAIVLCANCHRLFDDKSVSDVTQDAVRRRATAEVRTESSAILIRDLTCRLVAGEVGKKRTVDGKYATDLNRLVPLLSWLKTAVAEERLPPPHRFGVMGNSESSSIDLGAASVTSGVPTGDMPLWKGGEFGTGGTNA